MKTRINSMVTCIILVAILSILSFKVFAVGDYINDQANVLSSNVISKANDNFSKLEKNTKAQVRIHILKSLDGKNIDEVALGISKETSTNKYAIFIVAIKEHKNEFIVGAGLNDVFSNSEIDRIANLPNQYFKTNDFNTGILKVGQAIDEDITTKAVISEKNVVKSDGLGITVERKKSYTSLIIFIILLIIAVAGFIYYLKYKADKRAREFAREHNLDYDKATSSKSFKSAKMDESSSFSKTSSNTSTSTGRNVHHTTVINNSSGNDLLTGMMLNEMMHNHHDHQVHHEPVHHAESIPSYSSNDDENKISSGDWGLSSGSSDWGSSSDSSSFNSGSSDSGTSDW